MKLIEFAKETKEKVQRIEKLINKFRGENNINPLICPHFHFEIFSTDYPLVISVYFEPFAKQEIVYNIDDVVVVSADKKARKEYPEQIEQIIEFIKNLEI